MINSLPAWLPDIGFGAAFLTLLILFFGAGVVVTGQQFFHQLRNGGDVLLRTAFGFLGGTAMISIFSYALVSNIRRDHLLRVGTPRYTVATVGRNYYSRSGRKFVFDYRVGAYRNETNANCGESGCPPPGTRRYVRFAAEAPDVCKLTDLYVPDTLQTIPPLGWAKLP